MWTYFDVKRSKDKVTGSCPVVVPYQNLTLAINWCSSRLWHSFRISTPVHRFPHTNDTQSKNIFCCLPRARLPSIFPVNAIASSSFFLNTWPKNLICFDVITFKRLLRVSALSNAASAHEICIMRLRNHNSVASSRVLIWCYWSSNLHIRIKLLTRHNTSTDGVLLACW